MIFATPPKIKKRTGTNLEKYIHPLFFLNSAFTHRPHPSDPPARKADDEFPALMCGDRFKSAPMSISI